MRLLITLFLLALHFSSFAKPVQIFDMQFWKQASNNTRLVLELSAPVTYNIFTLKSPHRLVVDLKNTKLFQESGNSFVNHSLVKNIRALQRRKNDLRLILYLMAPARTKSFLLKPDATNGHRLVVDINTFKQTSPDQWFSNSNKASPGEVLPQPVITNNKRDFVIAIDAGHGGIDPGAIGSNGTKEKDVTLIIAKELAAIVTKEPGMRAVLIRDGDYFIKLRQRINLARKSKADLFISIHADAFPHDRNVQGSSVYMLSHKGTSSEAARWLAKKENAADLIGGINLSDKNDLLASVLLNLSQAGALEASAKVGKTVLKALKKVGKVHTPRVQRANFMVLRSPDIPSILVETAFISNPNEEKKLNDPKYRLGIAAAIMTGIREYFADKVPSDVLLVRR